MTIQTNKQFLCDLVGLNQNSAIYGLSLNKEIFAFLPNIIEEPKIEFLQNIVLNTFKLKLNYIIQIIKNFQTEEPKPIKPSTLSNKELQNILQHIPSSNERFKLTTILKSYQKTIGSSYTISEKEYLTFINRLFSSINEYIEKNNLTFVIDCITIFKLPYRRFQFINYNNINESILLRRLMREHKANFYAKLVESFQIDEIVLNKMINYLDLKLIKLPMIKNSHMFLPSNENIA